MKWLNKFFGGRPIGAGDAIDLQRDNQLLRLELADRESQIGKLEQEIQRTQRGARERVGEIVESRIEKFLSAAAGPASQLVTQAHLLEREHKPVESRDVLAVAKRLVKHLEELEMCLDGEVGEVTKFDPDRHTPLGDSPLSRGDEVAVRFVAVRYRDKIIRKAGVQKMETG